MRKRLEPWLMSIWYGERPAPLALRALAGVYSSITAARAALYRKGLLRSHRAPVPVIVVGNLTAGGSGKTPTIIALAQALRERGWNPGILSRGYGGRYRAPWLQVHVDSDPAQIGDEPLLMARSSGQPVVVARQRIKGAVALAELGCDVVLADDGLQHHALQRDLEILVVHGQRRFGNQRMLPAGPLREPVRADRFQLVLVNGGTPHVGEYALHSELGSAIRLSDGAQRELRSWRGQAVHACAAIADPQRFFDALGTLGLKVHPHPFPDHHLYLAADLDFAADNQLDLLCTGKDAVKLHTLGALPGRIWEVPLHCTLPAELLTQVDQRLRNLPKFTTHAPLS